MKFKLATVRKCISLFNWLEELGRRSMNFVYRAGGISILWTRSTVTLFTTPLKWRHTLSQMHKIGVTSLPLATLTALFTGMVLALQSAYQLRKFSAMQYTADLISLSMTRELAPVLTAMVVAGRVGASITAEIGTMNVTEQIDALKSLATDPVRYLAVPRYLAAFFMLAVLTIYADIIGILGGYMIAVFKLDISSTQYIRRAFDALAMKDVFTGLTKAFFFGIIISIVGCYFGFETKGGAEGVGKATTISVVTSLILIIAFDCFFTALFYFVL